MNSKRRKQSATARRPSAPKSIRARQNAQPGKTPVVAASPWWQHAAVLVALLLLNLALYYRTLGIGFLSVDDGDYVQNNPYIGSFHAANLKAIFGAPYFANYAPANLLSYALDVALSGGRSAFAFHLSNVLWHGAVVCLVYLLAVTIGAEILPAVAAAMLFLLHPAHVEVVAWISSRKDLVATAFAVLSMICCLRYLGPQPADRRSCSAVWYVGSLLAFAIASAAKQSVLLLPLVMLAWDIFVEHRRNWKMIADKIPFGLVALFFGWMTWQAQPATGQVLRPFVLAATQFANLWLLTGLGRYVLYRAAPDPASWSALARLALIAAAALVWVLPILFRRPQSPRYSPCSAHPDIAATSLSPHKRGEGWSEGNLVGKPTTSSPRPSPPAGEEREKMGTVSRYACRPVPALCYWVLVQMVPPMLLSFIVPITDRYLFLPSVGFCLLLVTVAAAVDKKTRPARIDATPDQNSKIKIRKCLVWSCLGALGLVWAAKTSAYVTEWADPRSVWYGAHLKTKDAQVAQFLGQLYQDNGERVDDFIKSGGIIDVTNQLRLATAVLRDPQRVESLRAEWLGPSAIRTNSIAYRERLWDLAWEQFEAAVARRGMLSTPNLFMCRGRLLVREGKFAPAIPEFRNAWRLAEASHYQRVRYEGVTHSLYAIGVAHWDMGNYREAEQWLLQAQATQRSSGQIWIASLDKDVERIQTLAAGH